MKGRSHVGAYAKAVLADGNPNPVEVPFVGSFAGHGLFKVRTRDRRGPGF